MVGQGLPATGALCAWKPLGPVEWATWTPIRVQMALGGWELGPLNKVQACRHTALVMCRDPPAILLSAAKGRCPHDAGADSAPVIAQRVDEGLAIQSRELIAEGTSVVSSLSSNAGRPRGSRL